MKATEQWCVKPITIQALAGKNRKILNFEADNSGDSAEWNIKVDDYLKAGAKNKIPNTQLVTATSNDKAADVKKLKGECNTLINKNTYDADFHENYIPFYDWCTVTK